MLLHLPRLRREHVCLPGDFDNEACFGFRAPDDRLASSGLGAGHVAVARPVHTVERFDDGDLLVVTSRGYHVLKRARLARGGALHLEDDEGPPRPLRLGVTKVEAKVVHVCRGGDHTACGLRRAPPLQTAADEERIA